MAQYSALWTSAGDPEYLQMKKVKQLTDRRLAMDISQMDKVYRRQVKRAQEKIRENQDILDTLEKEKETRARHILATYHKHQRMKAAANRFIHKFRMRKQQNKNAGDKKPETNRTQTTKDSSTNEIQKQSPTKGQRSLGSSGPGARPTIRHRLLMVHTFPYVYHSHGVKPCPRYDMFHDSQEYGPPDVTSEGSTKPKTMNSLTANKRHSLDRPHPYTTSTTNNRFLPPIAEVPSMSGIRGHQPSSPAKTKARGILAAFRAVGILSTHRSTPWT